MNPEAFLSMMAGKMRFSMASPVPRKWFGIPINFFISLKYFAFISSSGGLNCNFCCLWKIFESVHIEAFTATLTKFRLTECQNLPVSEFHLDFGQVFIECLQAHLILMFQGFVQLSVPVGLPRLHVIWRKALQTPTNQDRKQVKRVIDRTCTMRCWPGWPDLPWVVWSPSARPSTSADASVGQYPSAVQPGGQTDSGQYEIVYWVCENDLNSDNNPSTTCHHVNVQQFQYTEILWEQEFFLD